MGVISSSGSYHPPEHKETEGEAAAQFFIGAAQGCLVVAVAFVLLALLAVLVRNL